MSAPIYPLRFDGPSNGPSLPNLLTSREKKEVTQRKHDIESGMLALMNTTTTAITWKVLEARGAELGNAVKCMYENGAKTWVVVSISHADWLERHQRRSLPVYVTVAPNLWQYNQSIQFLTALYGANLDSVYPLLFFITDDSTNTHLYEWLMVVPYNAKRPAITPAASSRDAAISIAIDLETVDVSCPYTKLCNYCAKSSKTKRCGDCRSVRYCNVECQVKAREIHKPLCSIQRAIYDQQKRKVAGKTGAE